MPTLAASVLTIGATLAGMAVLDPRFMLALVPAIPIQMYAVRYYLRNAPPVYAEAAALAGVRSDEVVGTFRGISTIAAFGMGPYRLDRIADVTWREVRAGLKVRIVTNRFFTRLAIGETIGLVGLLAVGYWLVTSDLASVGSATAAMLLVLRLFEPVREMLLVVDTVQAGIASLARIIGVLRYGPSESTEPGEHPAVSSTLFSTSRHWSSAPSLHVEHLQFSYNEGDPVVRDVSFSVEPGECVAMVGASGAGKTTIAALIAGVLTPDQGRILLDGVDIGAPSTRAEQVVLVSQSPHVFAGTVRDQLTLARADATDDELLRALHAAQAIDWVSALPDGLDTEVGPHGHAISGAQAQHLALARLVLRDPALAILDEATAEAGSSGARLLESAAAAALSGRTAIVIAHRLTQAAAADRILVLQSGQVVEQGTHDELLESGGTYAALWAAWAAPRAH